MSLSVPDHLWNGGRRKADVSHGQIGEEEVHGSVQTGVRADGQDDEPIPQHSDQVHGQEQAGR